MASASQGELRIVQRVQGLLKFYLAQGVPLVVNLTCPGQGTLVVPPDYPDHEHNTSF